MRHQMLTNKAEASGVEPVQWPETPFRVPPGLGLRSETCDLLGVDRGARLAQVRNLSAKTRCYGPIARKRVCDDACDPATWSLLRPAAQTFPDGGRTVFERSMARIVQKFGGTSVADVERVKNVARRVKCEVDTGNEVAVVVSARAGKTNQLIDWTRDTGRPHDARENDVGVSSAWQLTAGPRHTRQTWTR